MAKTTLYGGRWKIVDAPRLGEGGQGEVFRVTDTLSEHAGEYALKRVLNPARRERFRREIEAINRLSHPNIITLLDHSALDDTDGVEAKQFIVMPIAVGGDLGKSERSGSYRDAIDTVLVVAKQLASALGTAHDSGIIHRDVKPQNVLFSGFGHDVWLSDFGICLLRGAERPTPADEVVGPRAFMAPELEDGGQLEVTPAADVYSLGKVIYFMISGGTILPRERLDEPRYSSLFDKGERYLLLQTLLRRMIAPLQSRVATMGEILISLKQIEDWELTARATALSPQGLAGIARLQRKAADAQRVTAANASARDQEATQREALKAGFELWLTTELQTVGEAIRQTGFPADVRAATLIGNGNLRFQTTANGGYTSMVGLELVLQEPQDTFGRNHILQIHLCQRWGGNVTVRIGGQPQLANDEPVRDLKYAVVAIYRQTLRNQHPSQSSMIGYVNKPAAAGQILGRVVGVVGGQRRPPTVQNSRLSALSTSFHPQFAQWLEFPVSEWPNNIEPIKAVVSQSIDTLIALVEGGASSIGP